MLMRQRKMIGFGDDALAIERHQSFDTQLGMAFSAINEGMADEKHEVSSAGSEEDNIDRASKDSPQKSAHQTIQVLETEKHLKAKEVEFVNTIQDNLIREFEITGTAVAPKTPIESLYLLQKKKQK